METCKCWEERQILTHYNQSKPVYKIKQICNGTKEQEECSCDGNLDKCNFYLQKNKEECQWYISEYDIIPSSGEKIAIRHYCKNHHEKADCKCGGDKTKCDFFSMIKEKAIQNEQINHINQEKNKMNTAEMYLQAQKDGMCYKIVPGEECSENFFYQKNKGFFDDCGNVCYTNIWNYFDDMMQEQWILCSMTKTEAEQILGVKIID